MCEDYRAGASADFEIDKADHEAGKKITIPMLALWGDTGVAQAAATPLDTWKMWATKVSGAPIDSGHFLTEENPDATAKALRSFSLRSPDERSASGTVRAMQTPDVAALIRATGQRRALKKSRNNTAASRSPTAEYTSGT